MICKIIFLHFVFSLLLKINGKEIKMSVNSIQNVSAKKEMQKNHHTKTNTSKIMNSKSIRDPRIFCQSFQSCFECVNNVMYPCNWCHDYGCTDKAEKVCPEAVAKINKNKVNSESSCPYIKHDGAILVPAGMRINLKVTLHAPDPVIYDKEVVCQIHFKQSLTHLKGLIMNDIIYCYPVILQTDNHGETNTGYLKIIWGGLEPVSNGIPVEVYDCENLADNCNDCKLIPVEYACGWCDKIKKCVIADKCGNSLIKWSLNRMECEAYDRQLLFV